MKRAGIEKRYWKIEFETLVDSIKQTEAYRKAISYVQQLSKWFIMAMGSVSSEEMGRERRHCYVVSSKKSSERDILHFSSGSEVPLILNRWKTKKPKTTRVIP